MTGHRVFYVCSLFRLSGDPSEEARTVRLSASGGNSDFAERSTKWFARARYSLAVIWIHSFGSRGKKLAQSSLCQKLRSTAFPLLPETKCFRSGMWGSRLRSCPSPRWRHLNRQKMTNLESRSSSAQVDLCIGRAIRYFL